MKLLLILILFLPQIALCEDIVAQSLAQGSCWVKKSDDKIAFASFNQNIATNLYGEHFQQTADKIKQELPQQYQSDFDSHSLDIFVHCGTYGSSFVFNFNSGEHNLCVWAHLDENEIKFGRIHAAVKGERRFCNGHLIGQIIVKHEPNVSVEQLENDPTLSAHIDKIDPIVEGVYKITLKEAYFFKEPSEKKFFEKSELIKSVDLNGVNHPVGESLLLYSLDI